MFFAHNIANKSHQRILHEVARVEPSCLSATTTTGTQGRCQKADKYPSSPENFEEDFEDWFISFGENNKTGDQDRQDSYLL